MFSSNFSFKCFLNVFFEVYLLAIIKSSRPFPPMLFFPLNYSSKTNQD